MQAMQQPLADDALEFGSPRDDRPLAPPAEAPFATPTRARAPRPTRYWTAPFVRPTAAGPPTTPPSPFQIEPQDNRPSINLRPVSGDPADSEVDVLSEPSTATTAADVSATGDRGARKAGRVSVLNHQIDYSLEQGEDVTKSGATAVVVFAAVMVVSSLDPNEGMINRC